MIKGSDFGIKKEVYDGTMVKGTDFEISKEVYDRAQAFDGHITEEDQREIFPGDLYWGYGVYRVKAYEKDGKYYCSYVRGESCD